MARAAAIRTQHNPTSEGEGGNYLARISTGQQPGLQGCRAGHRWRFSDPNPIFWWVADGEGTFIVTVVRWGGAVILESVQREMRSHLTARPRRRCD